MSRLIRPLLATIAALTASAAAAAAAGAAPLPGVPVNASLLFTLDADSGTLRPAGDRLTLTLKGVEPDATWFTDRPDRNAGRVRTTQLIGAWPDLEFDAVPPNAALVLERAPRKRDTVALELRDPVYDATRRTLRFSTRRLDALGPQLRRLDGQVDQRIARRFGPSTLFIDNAAPGGEDGCKLGQPQLLATTQPLLNMLPADGRSLPLRDYEPLAYVYGDRFGGDLRTNVGLPNLPAPAPGTQWYVCVRGSFPSQGHLGEGHVGEVDLWIGSRYLREGDDAWVPADGRTMTLQDRLRNRRWGQVFAPREDRVTLPTLAAAADMTWLVCVNSRYADWVSLGQIDLFAGEPPEDGGWIPADGRSLPTREHSALDAVLNGMDDDRWKSPDRRFTIPDVPSPAPGLRYYIATRGVYPVERQ
jgi:microcystin-dependent protein